MSKDIRLHINGYVFIEIEKKFIIELKEKFTFDNEVISNFFLGKLNVLDKHIHNSINSNDIVLNIITPQTITSIFWLLHMQTQQSKYPAKKVVNCYFGEEIKKILKSDFDDLENFIKSAKGLLLNSWSLYQDILNVIEEKLEQPVPKPDKQTRKFIEKYKFDETNERYESFFGVYFEKELELRKTETESIKTELKRIETELETNKVFEELVEKLQESKPIRIDSEADFQKVFDAIAQKFNEKP